jgi:signal transduction histidine kinase
VPITVQLVGSEHEVVASVHNGGFIAPDLMPRLFEPFQPGVGRRTRAEGLGLGLYIVQQIVHAHGGDVQVSSSPAEGTKFEVRLPRRA